MEGNFYDDDDDNEDKDDDEDHNKDDDDMYDDMLLHNNQQDCACKVNVTTLITTMTKPHFITEWLLRLCSRQQCCKASR